MVQKMLAAPEVNVEGRPSIPHILSPMVRFRAEPTSRAERRAVSQKRDLKSEPTALG